MEVIRGTPIAEKLRTDDEFVVVQRGDVMSRYVDDRVLGLRQDLDERVELSDAIDIVEPRGTNSYLIDNGEWIQSTLELHSIKSLKHHNPPVLIATETQLSYMTAANFRLREFEYEPVSTIFSSTEIATSFLKARSTPSNTRVFFIGMQFRITPDDRIAPIYFRMAPKRRLRAHCTARR